MSIRSYELYMWAFFRMFPCCSGCWTWNYNFRSRRDGLLIATVRTGSSKLLLAD
jgi:hypothetical protein